MNISDCTSYLEITNNDTFSLSTWIEICMGMCFYDYLICSRIFQTKLIVSLAHTDWQVQGP